MEMIGEHQIPAKRHEVWKALNNPDILKECILCKWQT
jgi:carbon monoxide dehydrogenase subunit G